KPTAQQSRGGYALPATRGVPASATYRRSIAVRPLRLRVLNLHFPHPARKLALSNQILLLQGIDRMGPIMNVVNRVNLGLKQYFCAIETRPKRRIHNGILNGISKSSCGDQRVLLGVDAYADVISNACLICFFILTTYAAAIKAIGHSFGRPIVASGDDAIAFDDHGADSPAHAIRLLAHGHGDTHVVIISCDHVPSAPLLASPPRDGRRTSALILSSLFAKSKTWSARDPSCTAARPGTSFCRDSNLERHPDVLTRNQIRRCCVASSN